MRLNESTASKETTTGSIRAIVSACVGNLLEWYDFIVYATFAVPISHAFFPGKSSFISLMATFITFGVSFLARPLGAMVFGSYADKAGRRSALTFTVLLMALGSLIIAICPTAATIGIAAPVILVSARLMQGFSAGGEIGGALAFLVEYAPDSRRAYYAAFQQMAQGGALVLCGLVAIVLNSSFSDKQVNTWAWRIPFLLGIGIAPVGFYIRSQVAETELFVTRKKKAIQNTPLKSIFTEHWKSLLSGAGVVVLGTVSIYVVLYIPTFAQGILKVSRLNTYSGLVIVGAIMMTAPAAGILADRFSRKSIMLWATACFVLYPYPAFRYLIHHPTGGTLIAVQIGMAIIMTIYLGPANALLAELFPTLVRSTGVALAYSLSVTIFGGFTPAIVTALINYTGNNLAIAFWLMASAVVSGIAVISSRDRSRQELT